MQDEVMFAGFGGQGDSLAAKILAYAAMEQKYEVMWIPAYGPEMRGGTAYCTVIVADQPIGSPVIKRPGHLVALGAFVGRSGMVNWSLLADSVKKEFAKKAGRIDLNLQAIEVGRKAAAQQA